jgi:hypothetical protein
LSTYPSLSSEAQTRVSTTACLSESEAARRQEAVGALNPFRLEIKAIFEKSSSSFKTFSVTFRHLSSEFFLTWKALRVEDS